MEQSPKLLDDLRVHRDTILAWIRSCTTANQIPICEESVKKLVTDRFVIFVANGTLNSFELQVVESELFEAIDQQKLLISQSKKHADTTIETIA